MKKNALTLTTAKLSLGSAVLFLVLLILLHFLKPELDPSWRMVSEYEIGVYGWMMQLAFLSFAFSCVSLFIAIRSEVRKKSGYIGLLFVLISAIGLAMAGIFTTDSIVASKDAITTHGDFHGLAALLCIPGLPIAGMLISRGLLNNPTWAKAKSPILWAGRLTLICFLLFFISVAILLPLNHGKFGPEVTIGWFNRLMVVSYAAWLIVTSWWVIKLKR